MLYNSHKAVGSDGSGDLNPDSPGYVTLGREVSIDALKGEIQTEVDSFKLTNVSDDDVIFFTNQDLSNEYYQKWRSCHFVYFFLEIVRCFLPLLSLCSPKRES